MFGSLAWVCLGQQGIRGVPLGDDARLDRPVDRQGWVVPPQTGAALWVVWRRDLVVQLCVRCQRHEAVGETCRDVYGVAGALIELHTEPAEPCLASSSQVDYHVEYLAPGASHQLRLGPRLSLVVHTSEGPCGDVVREARLGQRRIQTPAAEQRCVEEPTERAAFIVQACRDDDEGTGQRRLAKL